MKKFRALHWLAATSLGMFVAVVIADTVPLRGTNSLRYVTIIPAPTNSEPVVTNLSLLMSINPMTIQLPTNIPPRLREIAPDIYVFEHLDMNDIIFVTWEPEIHRTKGGWRISVKRK